MLKMWKHSRPCGSDALQMEEQPTLTSNKMTFLLLHPIFQLGNDLFIWEARFPSLDADNEETSSVPAFQGTR